MRTVLLLIASLVSGGVSVTSENARCLLSTGQLRTKAVEGDSVLSNVASAANSVAKGESAGKNNAAVNSGRMHDVSDILCPFAAEGELLRIALRPEMRSESTGPPIHSLLDFTEGGSTKVARTCAIVSNSGVMLSHEHGAAIDEADLVFRFNDAPCGGNLSKYVGSRDDIRFMNHFMFEYPETWVPEEASSTLWTFQYFHGEEEFYKDLLKFQQAHRQVHVAMGDMNAYDLATRVLDKVFGSDGKKKLTVGFAGSFVAMAMCDEVRAYGFPETQNSEAAPFHYFGRWQLGSASKDRFHKATAAEEKSLWNWLAINTDVNETDVSVLPGWRSLQC
mmetsp:Transcript_32129/g.75451  ORF Transcript_32129/g.75451 Transcript_32129/m.75451 type:complete len:334 (-) Transcript_32129:42-1043(-)